MVCLETSRSDDGAITVFGKMAPGPAQDEIAALVSAPVAPMSPEEEEGEEDEEDTRPLWQRRLDDEAARDGCDRFGPPGGSSIP